MHHHSKDILAGTFSRRSLCKLAAASGLGLHSGALSHAVEPRAGTGVTFSFGTYGMKSMATEDAVRAVAETGYDGIEIAARPDWDSAPARMLAARRVGVRRLLSDSNLELTALMEHLIPTKGDAALAVEGERLKQVAQLGHDLSPHSTPLIQTVLGGGHWEQMKDFFLDRLGDWARVAERSGAVIAVKPHRGGAMSRPSEAAWLIQRLDNTPCIRMVYDYSHYAFRELPLVETIKTALPYTAHIAIKDAVRTDEGFRFELPGESGGFDYQRLFESFYAGGYRGDVCCEVSSMVSNQREYDPVAAAKTCYQNIAPIFSTARVPRRTPS